MRDVTRPLRNAAKAAHQLNVFGVRINTAPLLAASWTAVTSRAAPSRWPDTERQNGAAYDETSSHMIHFIVSLCVEAQPEALPQQVAEEGQSVVQLHLLVVESQTKGHGAQRIPAQAQSQDPPQGQAQAHPVVPASGSGQRGKDRGR
ncbi:hypothetical protein EYF80_036975 [Liparis tanakae]|uniref:Uncharacterized protein n=1 Tax=Liparis tanakae TaxID=230148 RepID=A0A4Z2GI23_9TELE|nr:hypothetical protein EYF80_036975 [Liparis tanakae]